MKKPVLWRTAGWYCNPVVAWASHYFNTGSKTSLCTKHERTPKWETNEAKKQCKACTKILEKAAK